MITIATFASFPPDEFEKAFQAAEHLCKKGIASAIDSCAAVETQPEEADLTRSILRAGGGDRFTLRIIDPDAPGTNPPPG